MRQGVVARLVELKLGEGRAVVWAFFYFLALLTGYYVLRPVREEMGIRGGVKALPWLFSATFVAMLVVAPLYAWVVARVPRRRIVPVVYRFFMLNLLVFWALLLVRDDGPAVPRIFYVWTAVYNLLVVSVFWSLMADLFTSQQGKRLFGFIAAGGTCGALLGPTIAGALVSFTGPVHLLLISGLLIEVALACVRGLFRAVPGDVRDPRNLPMGGGAWEGLVALARSPYLLAISVQTLLFAAVSTFIYLQQQGIVAAELADSARRTRLFAGLDLLVNLVALLLQVVVTGRVLSRLGLFVGLGTVPGLGFIGAILLAWSPRLAPVVLVNAVRRGLHFGIERPARETLFTVVDRAEKYKAKSVIDTVVYRGADAASGWAHAGLQGAGLASSHIFVAAVPLALGGLGLAAWLSRQHRTRSAVQHSKEEAS